jgi:hypothetical protein
MRQNSNFRQFGKAVLAGLLIAGGARAEAPAYEQNFLSDYSQLAGFETAKGWEFAYAAPGAFERLVNYTGVMVDQAEVHISPDSPYRGAKPDDLKAVSELMRDGLAGRLLRGGYNVVEAPAPGIIYLRMALTDLSLKKKKRGLLAYTPVGAVVKAGSDLVREMMDKYDILGMAIQGELVDSQTGEVLLAIVSVQGDPAGKERIDFDELELTMQDYGSRLRCRLDAAKRGEAKAVDCRDPANWAPRN